MEAQEYTRVAEVEIKYHPARCHRPKVEDALTASTILRDNWNKGELEYRETFKIMLMNTACRVLGIRTISEGGIDCTSVDVRMVLQTALLANAKYIIACHNHPSGNRFPSIHDDRLTNEIQKGCQAVGLRLIDHVIITLDDYYSYSENGKL